MVSATVSFNHRAIEAIIEQLIELLDTADCTAAIEAKRENIEQNETERDE